MGLFSKICGRFRHSDTQVDKLIEEAYYSGFNRGHRQGLHLQPEFSRQFFSKIRYNPQTLVFEIPQETYEILKDQFTPATPTNPNLLNNKEQADG